MGSRFREHLLPLGHPARRSCVLDSADLVNGNAKVVSVASSLMLRSASREPSVSGLKSLLRCHVTCSYEK